MHFTDNCTMKHTSTLTCDCSNAAQNAALIGIQAAYQTFVSDLITVSLFQFTSGPGKCQLRRLQK
jgi:hypothetical protein